MSRGPMTEDKKKDEDDDSPEAPPIATPNRDSENNIRITDKSPKPQA